MKPCNMAQLQGNLISNRLFHCCINITFTLFLIFQYKNRNPSLLAQVSELQKMLHNPPVHTDIVITNGSQDGLCKAIEMMMTPNSHVVVQEPCYAGTLAIVIYLKTLIIKKV